MFRIFGWLFFILIFFCYVPYSYGEPKHFEARATNKYIVSKDNITQVTQTIQIKNLSEFFYIPTYSIELGFETVSNISAYDALGSLPVEIKDTESGNIITITFRGRNVGIGATRQFTFSYSTPDISRKKGSVWEIDIPGIVNPQEFESFDVQVVTPPEFGKAVIVKPTKKNSDSEATFSFTKNEIKNSGIYIAYGRAQYYSFDLKYLLSNSNLFPVKNEIAIPADTSYQNILISSMAPVPENVHVDTDGNWLAVYTLSPQKELSVKVSGLSKINALPSKTVLSENEKKQFTKANKYWETENPEVKKLANELKTSEKIYYYVVKKLSYNYDKVLSENKRVGASLALIKPQNAVCLEFSDLFIAIARAAGIPARVVEGYAYTQNSKLRPLSLRKDILHAWPEYYDFQQKSWIMVDPTWGNTTDGVDYFHSLDFNHFAFVRKGIDSTYPIPAGGYKVNPESRDIKVAFAKEEDFVSKPLLQLKHNFPTFTLSAMPIYGVITVYNKGPTLLPSQNITLTNGFDKRTFDYKVGAIPPYGSQSLRLYSGSTPFLTNSDVSIKIQLGSYTATAKVNVGILPKDSFYLSIGGVFLVAFIVSIIITKRLRRLFIQRHK